MSREEEAAGEDLRPILTLELEVSGLGLAGFSMRYNEETSQLHIGSAEGKLAHVSLSLEPSFCKMSFFAYFAWEYRSSRGETIS